MIRNRTTCGISHKMAAKLRSYKRSPLLPFCSYALAVCGKHSLLNLVLCHLKQLFRCFKVTSLSFNFFHVRECFQNFCPVTVSGILQTFSVSFSSHLHLSHNRIPSYEPLLASWNFSNILFNFYKIYALLFGWNC